MTLAYGLSLNVFLVFSVRFQCMLANSIISVERVEQYMHIPSEAAEVVEENRPAHNWPNVGKVEIHDLKVSMPDNTHTHTNTKEYVLLSKNIETCT